MDEKKIKFFTKIFWITFAAPLIIGFLVLILISFGALGFMPTFEELENPKSNLASEVYSSDQVVIGTYFRENRSLVQFDELSPFLINALVATEDVRFYQHSGIDFRSLARVIVKTVLGGNRSSGGGSTISQQLAKMLFPREQFDSKIAMIFRKLREWVIAIKLEKSYTKDEILAMYLNKFDFLNNAVGIKSSSKVYFNKSPKELNIEEAAMLVGMAKNPSYYNPVRRNELTLKRRNVVLSQMLNYDYITKVEFDSLKLLPLVLNYQKVDHKLGLAPYFREYLRTTMTAKEPIRENYSSWASQNFRVDSLEWANNPLYGWCNKNTKANGEPYNIYSDGIQIYTTINSKMQRYAEEAVSEHLSKDLQPLFYKTMKNRKKAPFSWRLTEKKIDRLMNLSMKRSERYRAWRAAKKDSAAIRKNFHTPVQMRVFSWSGEKDTVMTPMDSIRYYKFFLHAGFMSLEPQTGYVKAYVGDIDFSHFKFDNVMKARRQVGSTFKPFLYTLAMMPGGYSPCHEIPNKPITFQMPDGQKPYTPQFSKSKFDGKMISLKFGLALSLNQVSAWVMDQYGPKAAIKMARSMGIVSDLPEVYSLCVGAAEVTLAEMVGAYDTYANKGIFVKPIVVTRIEDKNGNIVSIFKPRKHEAISENTAFRMIEMMRGVVDFGTSTRIRHKYGIRAQIAGKTGTTNDNSDGWFIGITPNLVSGAWVGGEERSIRFASTAYGQGANMALPIWALYMKKVYADPTLGIKPNNFKSPKEKDGIITDCSEYKQIQENRNTVTIEEEKF